MASGESTNVDINSSGGSGKLRKAIEIPCDEVTNEHINSYLEYQCECPNCRLVMEKARLIVTEAHESSRKDYEIRCYGEHISLCFYSGSRGNKISVIAVEGKVQVHTGRPTWNVWLRELCQRCFDSFQDVVIITLNGVKDSITGKVVSEIVRRVQN